MSGLLEFLVIVLLIAAVCYVAPVVISVVAAVAGVYLCFKVYEHFYYKSRKFSSIRSRVSSYVEECNKFNAHVSDLKNDEVGFEARRYGSSDFHDASKWNYKRKEYNKSHKFVNEHVHDCSRAVCANSKKQPLKYVCKYFNISTNEESLNSFEGMLNNFTAAQEGKKLLKKEREEIVASASADIPWLIRKCSKKLPKMLGLLDFDYSNDYFPRYVFKYVSSGGNASMENVVTLDINNLNEMVEYINSRIKWKKSIAGQRALMTSSLRKEILVRDNYKCKQCGVSIADEPHLLLEVDHIIPVSKGGLTTRDNLQTLCWRCNRTKSDKIITA